MKAGISELEIRHMKAFPPVEKARVLDIIMSKPPLKSELRADTNYYEKSLLKLRSDGYGLIDVQPLETALTTVWYRRGGLLPALFAREDVTMLMLEINEGGESTTVINWRF